jgi:A/G-specific adenine glycosylase
MIDEETLRTFQDKVWDFYRDYGRHDLPWRQAGTDGFSPYAIAVSEIMLQQTQVNRVTPKYLAFLKAFPSVASLAAAELGDVLRMWSGLGYNRRAKFLHQAAQRVVQDFGGVYPRTVQELETLPGIGRNTAGAIAAYAYNQPVAFIETNIRTVFIHHFFGDREDIHDREILPIVQATLPDDGTNREWYWALMDYGSYLKQTVGNQNHRSTSYAKQSTFHGSRRQVRGQVLRLLATKPLTTSELKEQIADERLAAVVEDLLREQMIREQGGRLTV